MDARIGFTSLKQLFVGTFGAYLLLFFANKTGFELPVIVRSYFADLLCMPVILCLNLFSLRWIRSAPLLVLSPSMIAVAVLCVAVIFEIILPQLSIIYTADLIDALLYIVGGTIFFLTQQFEERRFAVN